MIPNLNGEMVEDPNLAMLAGEPPGMEPLLDQERVFYQENLASLGNMMQNPLADSMNPLEKKLSLSDSVQGISVLSSFSFVELMQHSMAIGGDLLDAARDLELSSIPIPGQNAEENLANELSQGPSPT